MRKGCLKSMLFHLFLLTAVGVADVALSFAETNPLYVDPDGTVTVGNRLEVGGNVKAASFDGDGSAVKFGGATLAAIQQALAKIVPIGTTAAFAGDVSNQSVRNELLSRGWLVCDGREYVQNDFPDLFAMLGHSFGGSTAYSFNVPDMRGRFIRGVDGGTTRDPDANSRYAPLPGGNTGDRVGSVQEDLFRFHQHDLEQAVYEHYRSFLGADGGDHALKQCCGGVWVARTVGQGGGETRPKNINMNWIIKAKYVY